MNESSFKQKIKRHLVEHGWDVQMIETSTGRGVPDMNVSSPGPPPVEIWIEAKYGDKEPVIRPEQRAWMIRANAFGRTAMVVWSWPGSKSSFNVRYFVSTMTVDGSCDNLDNYIFDHLL